MADFDVDLFVIGGGSAGVRAARMAASRGAKVALAEVGAMGGTCVNVGCIPKKLYSYAAHYGEGFAEAAGFGWQVQPARFDWATLKAQRAKEISRLNGVYTQLLNNTQVRIYPAWASVVGPHAVQVDGQVLSARDILVVTGGKPVIPDMPGKELVISSDQIFDLEPFPQRLLVVGGGYIACEFASIFNGLGSQVTQLYRGEQVLRGFDDEVRDFAAAQMRGHGVDLRVHADVAEVRRSEDGLLVRLQDGQELQADAVLYATGRAPRTQGLGLAEQGVALDERGAIVVDAQYRSSVPSIYAVGDVIDRIQLTPVALGEAMVVVDQLVGPAAGQMPRQLSYDFIPTAVFTHPNIGTVGWTESQARERLGAVRIYRSDFKPLKHTLSGSSERCLMKLVVDDASDRVVGLHMVGADAGEIVQGFAVAMKAGATKAIFDATVGIHPTAAEEFVTLRDVSRR
jgi:glutathione reductase (NADPH)